MNEDQNLKDMWQKLDQFIQNQEFYEGNFDQFIRGSSGTVGQKIKNMLGFDIGLKVVIILVFVIDTLLYFHVQRTVGLVCLTAAALIVPLIVFELNTLQEFKDLSQSSQTVRDKLTGMLVFLKSRSMIVLVSLASTYLFFFTAGLLVYFFATYGELRRMGSLDIFVFPTICMIGVILNYFVNENNIRYQVTHLELCLADLEEDKVKRISRYLEEQRKKDERTRVMIGVIAFLGLLLFIGVLKGLGI